MAFFIDWMVEPDDSPASLGRHDEALLVIQTDLIQITTRVNMGIPLHLVPVIRIHGLVILEGAGEVCLATFLNLPIIGLGLGLGLGFGLGGYIWPH